MKIKQREVGGVVILDCKGWLTLGEGDEALKAAIAQLMTADKKQVLLNLADVPYMDAAGLGETERSLTTVRRQNGDLKLLSLTKRIQDLLVITKLMSRFETFDDEPKALASFTD